LRVLSRRHNLQLSGNYQNNYGNKRRPQFTNTIVSRDGYIFALDLVKVTTVLNITPSLLNGTSVITYKLWESSIPVLLHVIIKIALNYL